MNIVVTQTKNSGYLGKQVLLETAVATILSYRSGRSQLCVKRGQLAVSDEKLDDKKHRLRQALASGPYHYQNWRCHYGPKYLNRKIIVVL